MPQWCWPSLRVPIRVALAELLKPKLEALPSVPAVEIGGPGSICVFTKMRGARVAHDPAPGRRLRLSTIGKNERVNVEYVSAKPDRALHMGIAAARWRRQPRALLEAAGFSRDQGILCHDAGAQSIHSRARSTAVTATALGEDVGETPRECIR